MNTLYIHDGKVELIGFKKLTDKAFFSFRNSGLVISGNRMDIVNPQEEYGIEERTIIDGELYGKLQRFGFSEANSFAETEEGTYFTTYPCIG